MTEEQAECKVKLTGRGGPGRGQGAPKGNSNAKIEPGKKRVKRVRINLTLAVDTMEYLNWLKAGRRKSLGKLIDQLVEESKEAAAEIDRQRDEFWQAMDNASFAEG